MMSVVDEYIFALYTFIHETDRCLMRTKSVPMHLVVFRTHTNIYVTSRPVVKKRG